MRPGSLANDFGRAACARGVGRQGLGESDQLSPVAAPKSQARDAMSDHADAESNAKSDFGRGCLHREAERQAGAHAG